MLFNLISRFMFCFFIMLSLLQSNNVLAANNSSNKQKKTVEKQTVSNIQPITGFASIGFDDGIVEIITKLKELGVDSILINDEFDVSKANSNDITLKWLDDDEVFRKQVINDADNILAEEAVKYCKQYGSYVFNNIQYCGRQSKFNKLSAKTILISGIPFRIEIYFENSVGYPVKHFNNTLKLQPVSAKYSNIRLLSTSRISRIDLLPISTLTSEDVVNLKKIIINKYGKYEDSYFDANNNGLYIYIAESYAGGQKMSYSISNTLISKERKIYEEHLMSEMKKINSGKKDLSGGL